MEFIITLLGLLSMLAFPVFLVIFIVQTIRKKPKKVWGFSALGAVILFFICMSFGTACSHEWTDATCTSPKTCSLCGSTDGEPLAHEWQAATCETASTCTGCGQTQGEPLSHTVEAWNVATNPTCGVTGTEEGTCSVCGNTITRDIATIAHTPGEWVVTVPATASSAGMRTNNCAICGEMIDSEFFELSAEEAEAQYKAACSSYTYQEIARNPNEYNGKFAKFTGEVIQVQQEEYAGTMIYVLRVNVTKTGSYYTYYEDTVFVTYYADADAPRILEDDIITMYGELTGEKTYTTVLGSTVTIPAFDAEYIDIL